MSRTIKDTKAGIVDLWEHINGTEYIWDSDPLIGWGNSPGLGRYFKRLLSRKRRQWRDTHERGRAAMESTVNYRAW